MAPKKNQKMSLGTFLQDENYGSWADEMEDMPLPATDSRPGYSGSNRRDFSAATGGMASFERRDNYVQREQLPLPTNPPFTAHLANLSFDVTQPDIQDFFRDCQVTNIRIVEDKLDRKPKGFGYVEFGTLDGLKNALSLSGSNLAGRQVRISVADPPKDRGGDPSRDFSDWTRKGPLPDLPANQRRVSDRPGFGNRSFDNMSDAGSERGSRRGFGGDGDGKSRDFSNWERRGPLSPAAGATPDLSLRGSGRQGSKDGGFRRNSPSWGEGRSQEGSRPPKREYAERPPPPPKEPSAADMDNQWRARMRPDAPAKSPTPETSNPPSPAPAPAPAVRPRLNLQKRTVSEADPASSGAAGDSKASPFGAARPVDTATKEREVEEKRQIAIRQKKEAEDKAKAERAEEKKNNAKEKGETAEKGHRRSSVKQNKEAAGDDETSDGDKAAPPKFELLRREVSASNDMVAEDEEEEEEETVSPEQDKAVKPREIVRDPTSGNANGSWRKGDAEKPAESETVALEEDGWSTVSKGKKQQNSRRNQPQRAIAS